MENSTTQGDKIMVDSMIPFCRFILVLLLRAGSVLVQLGSFPTENVYNVIFQNVLDVCLTIVSFSAIGYTLAFAGTTCVSDAIWIGSDDLDLDKLIFGYCALLTGTSSITMQLCGRLHAVASLTINLFYCAICFPLTLRFFLPKCGVLQQLYIFDCKVNFLDYGSSFVIYASSGIVGLIGSKFLGRRLLVLNEIHESSVGVESAGTTVTGYFLMIIGMFNTILPIDEYCSNIVKAMIVNGVIAMGVGMLMAIIIQVLLCRKGFHYWSLISYIQAAIASLVMILPGNAYYSPIATICITMFAHLIFAAAKRCVEISSLEDYCNVVSIYMVCSLIGILFPQLSVNYTDEKKIFFVREFYQITSASVMMLVYIATFSLTFLTLSCCKCLRNKSDEVCHKRSIRLRTQNARSFCSRLFNFNSNVALLEPGISGKMNSESRVIANFDQATAANLLNQEQENQIADNVGSDRNRKETANDVYKLQDLIKSRGNIRKEMLSDKCRDGNFVLEMRRTRSNKTSVLYRNNSFDSE